MTATAANPYETAARERKVARIVQWLDRLTTGQLDGMEGVDLVPTTSQQQARFVASLSPEMWADVGRRAGTKKPSEKTRAATIRFLRRRVLTHNTPPRRDLL